MKKIFTLLSIAALTTSYAQTLKLEKVAEGLPKASSQAPVQKASEQTLIQYKDGENFSDSTPVCADAINHDSRFFKLSDYGITGAFTVTKVDFVASSLAKTAVWAEVVTVAPGTNIKAAIIPGSALTLTDAYGSITTVGGENNWESIPLMETVEIPAGVDFGVAVGYVFEQNIWFGNNEGGETAPSYIGWPDSECVNDDGASTVASVGFPVSWIMNVTGNVEGLGTVELGSNKLAVYPNPATTEVNVKLEGSKVADVTVADVTGRVIPVSFSKDGKVDTSRLAAGVYFLRVKDDKGVTRIQKIIKK
ncbi:T9SS type A sorting domain-containing protein [Empedobacter falsenii]